MSGGLKLDHPNGDIIAALNTILFAFCRPSDGLRLAAVRD
jgi:hypothetical protein